MPTSLVNGLRAIGEVIANGEQQGFLPTNLPGVRFFWANRPVPKMPLLYQAGIIIIGQGHKIGYLDGRRFRYDAENYLVVSVPIPFECETHASLQEPLLGIFIDVGVAALRGVLERMGDHEARTQFRAGDLPRGVEPAPLGPQMADATVRLLHCLASERDSRVLGPAIVDELTYRVLLGPHGGALYGLTQVHQPYARVAAALERIHRDCAEARSVDDLAREAAMSVSAFHRAFKQVTGDSPHQYVKKIRLSRAHGMIAQDGVRVSDAARTVGYESPAHFSRDFKRYYGVPPSEIKESFVVGAVRR
ncbi:MAG: AraC family transcriptional regulator [Myxococcota bacterium]